MRGAILALFLSSVAICVHRDAVVKFDPNGYQHADGAISLHYRSDYVEPYFATKALIVAQAARLDIRQPADQWIHWLLLRQDKTGRFGRYCRKPGTDWRLCSPSDADDSMLALWLQLLYTNSPDSGLRPEWQESAKKARSRLDELRNGRLGEYHVSSQNHVALFMDNVEVYSALIDIARSLDRFGQHGDAQATFAQAEKLDSAIQQVFWNKHEEWFRPSIQKSKQDFYPDIVAQVYPWLADLPMDSNMQTGAAWTIWKNRFANDWLDKKRDPHPWGLVAMAALKFGDDNSAACWLSRSESLRFSPNWNVLEEAAFQVVEARLNDSTKSNPTACLKVSSAP